MFRLLGFLIGSLASIAALLLLIGRPDFHLGPEDVDLRRFDAAVEKLKAKQLSPPGEVSEEQAADARVPAPAEPADSDSAPAPVAPAADQPPVSEPLDSDALAGANEWHTFWTPFRTEIAARGFVTRLENVTGIDYRVIKVETGVYQVAFAYTDPVELESKLEQITAATGLDLSGALP